MDQFRGTPYIQVDLRVTRPFQVKERWQVLPFIEFFNLFNHANFGFPDNWTSDSTFGQIFYQEQAPTSVLGSGLNANVSARMIQVKAQIRF